MNNHDIQLESSESEFEIEINDIDCFNTDDFDLNEFIDEFINDATLSINIDTGQKNILNIEMFLKYHPDWFLYSEFLLKSLLDKFHLPYECIDELEDESLNSILCFKSLKPNPVN